MILTESQRLSEKNREFYEELFDGCESMKKPYDVCIQYFLDEDDEKLKDSLREFYLTEDSDFTDDIEGIHARLHAEQLLIYLKLYKELFHLKKDVFYDNTYKRYERTSDNFIYYLREQKGVKIHDEATHPDRTIIAEYEKKYGDKIIIYPMFLSDIQDYIGDGDEMFFMKYPNEIMAELKKLGYEDLKRDPSLYR